MMKHLLLLLFFALPAITFSQTNQPAEYCGSVIDKKWDATLEKNLKYMRSGNFKRSNVVRWAPLNVHLIGKANGTGRQDDILLLNRLCELNAQMEHTDIQFYLDDNSSGGIHHWDNDAWFDGNGFALMVPGTKIANSLNMYIVGTSVSPGSGMIVCGFYSGGKDVVSIQKSCYGPDNTTAMHEFGHLFTLPHTFNGSTNYSCGTTAPATWEKVDGSNCMNAGDRMCDTPPDYQSDRWNCNGSGKSNCPHVDPNGTQFFPSGTNPMAYSNDECMTTFSNEQISAMQINYDMNRTNLHSPTPINPSPITASLMLSEPLANQVVGFATIDFKWFAVQNASRYIIEISSNPSFGASSRIAREIVNTNSFTYNGTLSQNSTYYWRVRPFSEYYFCTSYSGGRAFTTSTMSVSNLEIDGVSSVKMFPNPSNRGQVTNMEVVSEKAFDASLKVFSVQGKLIVSETVGVTSGQNTFPIATEQLTSGVYIVSFESATASIQRKLIVNK